MKVVSELGSADKWEEKPTSNKIFNILNVFYVPSSVRGTEGIQQGRKGGTTPLGAVLAIVM